MNEIVLLSFLVVFAVGAKADEKMLFHLPLDGDVKPLVARGGAEPTVTGKVEFVEGRFGKALRVTGEALLAFPADGNLDKRMGTVCVWVRPHWNGNDGKNHLFLYDDRPFKTGENSIRFWKWSVGTLRFDVRDAGDNYLTSRVESWKAGNWYHIAASWDSERGTRLFINGERVAQKNFSFEPKPSKTFFIGAQGGAGSPDAGIDDLRIYPLALDSFQIKRVMRNQPLEEVSYRDLRLPEKIAIGKPFSCEVIFEAPQGLTGTYKLLLTVDDLSIAEYEISKFRKLDGAMSCTAEAVIPTWLYLEAGEHIVSARLAGTIQKNAANATKRIQLALPSIAATRKFSIADDGSIMRNGEVFMRKGGEIGLLYEGVFYPPDDKGMERARQLVRSGRIIDALRCRLIDEVDCSKTDHDYRENSPAQVKELLPSMLFRLVGSREEVTQIIKRRRREMKALPGFSYRMRVEPRPTPHILTVTSLNDAERYLEVAIDVAEGSAPSLPLTATGIGSRDLIHLGVTYTGREYATDGKPFVSTFMFFPKTDAIRVWITGSANPRRLDAKPAAVSKMAVYEVVDSLRRLSNPIKPPERQRERRIGLFYPQVRNMFDRYGFANAGVEARRSTARLFMDYCRFLGFNQFEFRAFELSPRTVFRCDEFEQAGDLDMFDEFLPLAEKEEMAVIPRVMYLHCYHKLLEGDDDRFQQDRNGKIMAFGREGPIPDPLHPDVQEVVKKSFRAILKRARKFKNIPALCFDTSIGGLYWSHPHGGITNAEVGYSKWDVSEFSRETGINPRLAEMTHSERYDWLRDNAWEEWISWRCRRWHKFITELRDMCRKEGKQLVLNVRIMPRSEWAEKNIPMKEIFRYSGYDPDLFRNEKDIVQCWFIRVNADRYFGRPYWKDWFFSDELPSLYCSAEPVRFELYFNYWELPTHPISFRVGPASPVGRAFFEPLTRALRVSNPYSITLFNWFRATIGHELDVRELARAFRALPAVEPTKFDGEIKATPDDTGLSIRWFGDRLCIINDSPTAKEVTISTARDVGDEMFDVGMNAPVSFEKGGNRFTAKLSLRAYDIRTLIPSAEK